MKAWITRDKDGEIELCFDTRKPTKDIHTGIWYVYDGVCDYVTITDVDLPEGVNPQWSDDEPTEVELKIERVKL